METETDANDTATVTQPKSSPQTFNQTTRAQKRKAKRAQTRKEKAEAAKQKQEGSEQPHGELRDLWGDAASCAPKAPVDAQGYEVDTTPAITRKKKYLRARPSKEVQASKQLVVQEGLKVAVPGVSFNPLESKRQEALQAAADRDDKETKEAEELRQKLNPEQWLVGQVPSSDDESEMLPPRKATVKTQAQRNAKKR